MMLNENEMYENVLLWLLFCILPSFLFSLILIVFRTVYRTTKRNRCNGLRINSSYFLSVFFKEPPVIVAPLVTPFIYSEGSLQEKIIEYDDNTGFEYYSKTVFFEIDYELSYANNLVTVCLSCTGLILKSQLKWDFVLAFSAFFLVSITALLYLIKRLDGDSSKRCFEHGKYKTECTHCSTKYGIFIEDFKWSRVCKHHGYEECSSCGECI